MTPVDPTHPRQGTPKHAARVCALLAAWVLALTLGPWLGSLLTNANKTVVGPSSPAGIVNLQLAFTAERADGILTAWGSQQRSACAPAQREGSATLRDCARQGLGLDRWLILLYVAFGTLVFRAIPQGLGVARAPFWRLLSWAPLAAGVADLGENYGLALTLAAQTPDPTWVALTGGLALIKFGLLICTLIAAVFVLGFCTFYWSVRRGTGLAKPPPYRIGLDQVMANEGLYLYSRRQRAGLPDTQTPPIGLALSGGGIRSATLSLGAIQTLAKAGLGGRIDYLSTVSGGGYMGAALSSLLSCRVRNKEDVPDDPDQYVFGPGDKPHFDLGSAADGPFHDDPDATKPPPHRDWLGGRLVVSHLRAFGDYLVRRRRATDRDVLRAIGTVLAGSLMTLTLFAAIMQIPAALVLAAVTLTGTSPFPAPCSLWGYLGDLVAGAGGPQGLIAALAVGAWFGGSATLLAGFCADLTPEDWFNRPGDTQEDARQRRSLWILSGLSVAAALASPGLLRLLIPGVYNALLLPVAFLGGALLMALLSYLALGTHLVADRLPFDQATRSYHGAIIALYLYLTLLTLVIIALVTAFGLLAAQGEHPGTATALGGSGFGAFLGTLVSGLMAWWHSRKGMTGIDLGKVRSGWQKSSEIVRRAILGLAVSAVLVFGLALAMAVVEAAVREAIGLTTPEPRHYLTYALLVAAVVWLLGRSLDFNTLSLHYFYRDRLSEAYLTTLGPPQEDGGPVVRRDHSGMRLADLHGRLRHGSEPDAKPDPATFTQYRVDSGRSEPGTGQPHIPGTITTAAFPGAATAAPYHLCNACLNLATERDPAYRSRKSDIFLFSKLYCGSTATGFVDTEVYRAGETKVARAMTISGAAADSAAGRDSFFAQAFAATLFNIRLGQWLENPRYRKGAEVWRRETGVFWPWWLLRETMGLSDARHRLIHLSDGGHTGDNLGLVPLLQRRCGLILAVDGEQDPELGFGSLMHALQYAEADLGIRVELRLDHLVPDQAGLVAGHYAIGTICYPKTLDKDEAKGQLVVLKSSLHQDDDEVVRRYRQTHPVFPHETTLDQFFAEEQFETYRRLGQNLARQLLEDHPEIALGRIDLPHPAGPPAT